MGLRKAHKSWSYETPGKHRVLYSVDAAHATYRDWFPGGSMEPHWLRFLNQTNLWFEMDTRSPLVREYIFTRIGTEVRYGPYLWLSLRELNLFTEFIGEDSRELALWTKWHCPFGYRTKKFVRKGRYMFPNPGDPRGGRLSTSGTPVEIKREKPLDIPKGKTLFGQIGHLSSLASAKFKLQRFLGVITEGWGWGNIPTWYSKRFGINAWKVRTRLKRLKSIFDIIAVTMLRLHYVYYVIHMKSISCRGTNQCLRKSDADLTSTLLCDVGKGRNFYHAASRLYKRLIVLFSSQ